MKEGTMKTLQRISDIAHEAAASYIAASQRDFPADLISKR